MRFTSLIVEQLDRAASELHADHEIGNRLALILVDNATELLVHRQCSDLLEMHEWHAALYARYQRVVPGAMLNELDQSESILSKLLLPKQLARAKGRSLPDKLHVLRQIGDITAEEHQFIATAHNYRNELYHAGLTHDHIVRAVASQYFLLCCELFSRMKNHGFFGMTMSSEDNYSEIFRKYLGVSDDQTLIIGVDRKALSGQLLAALPSDLPSLPATLTSSAHDYIKELSDNFEFVIQNNPQALDADQVLALIQWQRDLAFELGRANLLDRKLSTEEESQLADVAKRIARDWKQRFRTVPYKSWRVRASRLANELNPLIAMKKYEDLRGEMRYLEDALEPAVDAVDQWVQSEIDRRRGK
ncbi:MAG: hypothetical protein F4091_10715 [Acidimicrobiales bacterium]|nr:hypothetical protein [Acidimicrobiales bacterium]MYD82362.1 hypothetical protein [Acidimicrobiales bacterium]MYJ65921.1 hypothetical protein [Acidimicrobiales bacterium]